MLAALEAAPAPVRLEGRPLSACLTPRSSGADLQTVGASLVGAATELGERARGHPESASAIRLGYLVGAVQRGAGGPAGPGIHSELVRRVEQEMAGVDGDSHALRAGLEAGRRTG